MTNWHKCKNKISVWYEKIFLKVSYTWILSESDKERTWNKNIQIIKIVKMSAADVVQRLKFNLDYSDWHSLLIVTRTKTISWV